MPAPPRVKLPPRKKRRHFWSGFLSGGGAGVCVTWLIMSGALNFESLSQQQETTKATDKPQDKHDDLANNLPIEFYKLLLDSEYEVPAHKISQQVRENSPDKRTDSAERYRLLAGSFRNIEDANRRRAHISLLGLAAHIEKVTQGGKIWQRVMLGPFDSLQQLEAVRHNLLTNDIDTIVLKLKNSARAAPGQRP